MAQKLRFSLEQPHIIFEASPTGTSYSSCKTSKIEKIQIKHPLNPIVLSILDIMLPSVMSYFSSFLVFAMLCVSKMVTFSGLFLILSSQQKRSFACYSELNA